ncbi:hypothetical protein TcCL_ESM02757 [Trypanosoma cruzi]|nr:hypothetical protein TcCL_ESM02757 [Trypanosoma cruzi]
MILVVYVTDLLSVIFSIVICLLRGTSPFFFFFLFNSYWNRSSTSNDVVFLSWQPFCQLNSDGEPLFLFCMTRLELRLVRQITFPPAVLKPMQCRTAAAAEAALHQACVCEAILYGRRGPRRIYNSSPFCIYILCACGYDSS